MADPDATGVHPGFESTLELITDGDLRHGLLTLFEQARSEAAAGDVDVVVLAARRLGCVYQLLVRQGMKEFPDSCQVVSDRFLDIDLPRKPSWRKVLILDDSVILGTTLLRIHSEVKEKAGESVSVRCRAVCVDREQCADYMLEAVDFTALFDKTSAEVQTFSEDIVHALFAGGVPFFSDFPMTTELNYSATQRQALLTSPAWYCADVTAPLFDGQRREALAHIPTDATEDAFLRQVPPSVSALVEAVKVRSYSRFYANGAATVRFVPIVMLAPCRPDDLDLALEEVIFNLGDAVGDDEPALPWQKWRPVAKHRLLQMYASSCALESLFATHDGPVDALRQTHLDELHVQLYFGKYARRIMALFDAAVQQFRNSVDLRPQRSPRNLMRRPDPSWVLEDDEVRQVLHAANELIRYTGTPDQPRAGQQVAKVGLIFSHAIASVFGFINSQLEVPQRAHIRSLNDMAEYLKIYPENNPRRILGQGITMHELTSALIPEARSGTSWTRSQLSLGVDIGNDLGVIVPVTQVDQRRNLVYRCYRLGETAPVAGNPLPNAAVDDGWDALARSAMSGTTLVSRLETLKATTGPKPVKKYRSKLPELKRTVREIVPGTVEFQMTGTVIEVTDDEFVADFRDEYSEPPMQRTTFPLDQLVADGDQLGVGAVVVWTVMRGRVGVRERISRVRLRIDPPINPRQLALDAQALVHLAKVDDDPADTTC